MRKNLAYRSWYYFRIGYGTYFSFIFAAINTLTVTYYLAIEKYSAFNTIFPSFIHYMIIITIIGIPLLVAIGYFHYKKSVAYKAEADIVYESNPYALRQMINIELILKLNLNLSEKLLKILNNEKLSKEEIDEIKSIQKDISEFIDKRNRSSKEDLNYFKNRLQS